MHMECLICLDEIKLQGNDGNICSITCGHVFHKNCITDWVKRSQTCPICHRKTLKSSIRVLYPTVSNDNYVTKFSAPSTLAINQTSKKVDADREMWEEIKRQQKQMKLNVKIVEEWIRKHDQQSRTSK